MLKKNNLFAWAVIFGIFFSCQPVLAESDYIYIDKNYAGNSSDGSQEKPYTEIEKAIEACSQKCTLNIKNGIYNENIILKEGMKIIGEDSKKTIITSLRSAIITAKGANDIENITVLGGFNGIIFENGGSLKNSFVRDASRIAITLKENGGNVDILNSHIKNNGKGIYAEKGSQFNIVGNVIGSFSEINKEEGIDIREETKGKISRNYITSNGEGGIEIVVGGSNLLIEENVIQDNQSSGIALHFYRIARETGEISIQKNAIRNNKKNGLVCKNPSGGAPPYEYFSKSISLNGNIIKGNELASIDSFCQIKQIGLQKENVLSMAEIKEIEKLAETNPEEEQPYSKIILESLIAKKQLSDIIIDSDSRKLARENKVKVFFFGPNYKKIKIIKNEIKRLSDLKKQLEEAAQKFEKIGSVEDKRQAAEEIGKIENTINIQGSAVSEREKLFSLFGWLFKLWYK